MTDPAANPRPLDSTLAPSRTPEEARFVAFIRQLQTRIIQSYEALEDAYAGPAIPGLSDGPAGRFRKHSWARQVEDQGEAADAPAGGGTMAVMKGRVFEKVGVNISVVSGRFSPTFRAQIKGAEESGGAFWAAGLSLVAHPVNPHAPTAHFNTRMLATSRSWIGGGGDLTPMLLPFRDDDVAAFHGAFQAACDRHDPAYSPRFKAWCDRYFFLPHRGEARGAGGIFYDDLNSGDPQADFAFAADVADAFATIYPAIVDRRMNQPWDQAERQRQLQRRGRYVEFNLLYDRGTTFGLRTGGNVEAILMSLPPHAAWP